MPAGYSSAPLIKKLGIKEGYSVLFLMPPTGYMNELGTLPNNITVKKRLTKGLDFVHFFVNKKAKLEARFDKIRDSLAPAGMLWISWPKGGSGIETDLNRDIIRKIGLDRRLVDVKVCAVDEQWSGLKFVRRVRDR